jgi:hypothetical protein
MYGRVYELCMIAYTVLCMFKNHCLFIRFFIPIKSVVVGV